MKILAHRGAHDEVPENSLEAFRRAVEMGADGVETDVRLSRDGQCVLVHDRLVNGKEVAELTVAQLGDHLPHPVVTLEAALQQFPTLWWNIEIKTPSAVAETCRVIERYSERTMLITSFDHRIVLEVAARTGVRCGVLTGHWVADVTGFSELMSQESCIDTIVWNLEFVTPELLSAASHAGWRNIVWNLQTPDDVDVCRQWGVEAIIADSW